MMQPEPEAGQETQMSTHPPWPVATTHEKVQKLKDQLEQARSDAQKAPRSPTSPGTQRMSPPRSPEMMNKSTLSQTLASPISIDERIRFSQAALEDHRARKDQSRVMNF